MKKTLTINISGVIFHIDEDAYISLNQYLELLHRRFSAMEGSREILEDIESRIAEILQARISEARQVITITDIEEIRRVMGEPAEIAGEEVEPEVEPETSGKGPKRFYRDPGNKVIAGVCSGIAAWFHIDPVWVRLAFILAVVLFGSGILLYIILWIVMPEAVTTTEKLQMRGERVTISNIERSLREEIQNLRQRLGGKDNGSPGVRPSSPGPTFAETILKGVGEVFRFVWRIVVVVLGLMLTLLGLMLAIALLAISLGWGEALGEVNGELLMSFPDMARLLFGGTVSVVYLQITLLLLFGAPVIAMIYNGVRMAFRIEPVRYLGLTLFNVWIIALILTAYFGFKFGNHFRSEDRVRTGYQLRPTAGDSLVIAFEADDANVKLLGKQRYNLFDEFRIIPDGKDSLNFLPNIYCNESEDSLYHVRVSLVSRGKSRQEARRWV